MYMSVSNLLTDMRKYPRESTLREAGFIWLMVLGFSPSWQQDIKPTVRFYLQSGSKG